MAGWLLASGFLVCAATLLPSAEYVFDEGVSIQQARLVMAGELPYRDFFLHQTPLYPMMLALVASPAPDLLFLYRLPSLLALTLCGLLVHHMARRLTSKAGGVIAALLFYTAPLQYYDLLAIPYALMLCTATWGLYLVWFAKGRSGVIWGALLFAVSILFKPISIAAALAAGLALAWSRERWHRLVWAAAAGAVGLGLAWVVFDLWSDGGFSSLMALQTGRLANGSGFEQMKQFPEMGGILERKGIGSAVEWNLRRHAQTYFAISASRVAFNPFLSLAVLTIAGQILLWSPAGRRWRDHRAMLTLWWAVPMTFSIFVWEPTFQTYFVQYLPPFCILASLFLGWLWDVPSGRRAARAGVVLAVAFAAASGTGFTMERRNDYALVPAPQTAAETWLLFDPFLNFVSGTQPGCGIIDPFNVYGDRSLVALGSDEVRSRHHISRQKLIACLENDPSIKIGLGYWASWFIDEPLRSYFAGLPQERFVPMRLHHRPAGSGMPPSPPRIRLRSR